MDTIQERIFIVIIKMVKFWLPLFECWKRIIKKFESIGSVFDVKYTTRSRRGRSEQNIRLIRDIVAESPGISIRIVYKNWTFLQPLFTVFSQKICIWSLVYSTSLICISLFHSLCQVVRVNDGLLVSNYQKIYSFEEFFTY